MRTKIQFLILVSLVLILGVSFNACGFDANAIKGDKIIVTEEKNLPAFDALHVSGFFKVNLVQGNEPHIRIETDSNIQEYVVAEVKGNVLTLTMKQGNSYNPSQLEVFINVNSLSELKLSGASHLVSDHEISSEKMTIHISGAGDLEMNVASQDLTTTVSGAASVRISGSADRHQVKISGVASVNCLNLNTRDTDVSLSGAGSAKVTTTDKLKASVSGVGSIEYAGDPVHKQLSTSGIGSIKPI